MQKFEDATAKSEDERAKLGSYTNSSSQLHIFASSPKKVRVTPSGHHKHLKPGRLLHPKSKCYEELYLVIMVQCSYRKLRGEELKICLFLSSIYTNLLMFIFMDLLTHVYTYEKKFKTF